MATGCAIVPKEIERKFLLASDGWRGQATRSSRIEDGLLLTTGDRKLRIRIRDGVATMAFKGPREGMSRDEFEYPIPLTDARHLIDSHCDGRILSKTRFEVPHGAFLWEVDVYDAPLSGVVLAEVELTSETVPLSLPDWLGEEVTGQPRYRKLNMLMERRARTLAD